MTTTRMESRANHSNRRERTKSATETSNSVIVRVPGKALYEWAEKSL